MVVVMAVLTCDLGPQKSLFVSTDLGLTFTAAVFPATVRFFVGLHTSLSPNQSP